MREHWDELCHLFEILCYLVEKPYGHRIDVYFTPNRKIFNNISVSSLVELCQMRKIFLRGLADVAAPLEHILEEYCRDLKDEVESKKRWYPKVPPLSIYVLTNALWRKNSDPEAAIKNAVDSLTTLAYPPSQVGIQFISFGENPDTFKRLENYDSGLGLKM